MLVVAVVGFAWAPSASAHTDPPGCTSGGNLLEYDLSDPDGIHVIHRNGDHVEITAKVKNDVSPQVCSVTDATVTVQAPAPDGTPGPTTTIATDVDLPAGTPPTTLPNTAPYDYNFDASTFKGPVSIGISGDFHFGDDHLPGPIGASGRTLRISKPHITLGVSRNPASGPAPLGVTYTYTATNDTPVDPDQPTTTPDLVAPNDDRSIISDDLCSPVTYVSGDTEVTSPPLLHDGETWTLTCTRVFGNPGTFTNTASIVGDSIRDGRPWPSTTAQTSVTVEASDMTVSKTHAGDFAAGATGQAYTLVARNSGNQATSGAVTLQDSLPSELTATAISGDGWSCDLGSLTCTRSDPLAGGASYPPVTVTVDVAADAPDQVTNVATVSGGGEVPTGNNSASDTTAITRSAPPEGVPPPSPPPPPDADPPDGEIRKVKVKGDDAKVTFRSDEPGSKFECKLDKKQFKPCTSPKTYRNLKDGKHKVLVSATDAAGNEDPRPDKAKFEI